VTGVPDLGRKSVEERKLEEQDAVGGIIEIEIGSETIDRNA